MSEQEFPVQGSLSFQPVEELEHPLMLKDIWDGEKDLKVRINKHTRYDRIINFTFIKQEWFKKIAKKYILYRCNQRKSFGTLLTDSKALRYFAKFLENQCVYSFEDINDEILSTYLSSISYLAEKTQKQRLQSLHIFCQIGTINQWFDISTYWFKGKVTRIKPNHNKIKYIPDEVLEQLDRYLYLLPLPLQRAIIIIRTLGLRSSELLQLKFDCLQQRQNKEWELHFINSKFNEQEDRLPIIPEIVEVIKEQQAYIRENLKDNFHYLFCGSTSGSIFRPQKQVMSLQSFNGRLNNLARQCEIKDKSGNIWNFGSHQFRRTVASKMTNSGIRQYIIQCYLRHCDPNMMQHYAHILPETEKREINQIHKEKKIIDITGQEVSINHPELDNDIGLQWLRSKMQPKALAMGFCARPQLLKPCPHANACMSCEHLRLDKDDLPALKQHLDRNKKLKEESENKGYVRQIKGIEEDVSKLVNLINILEKNNG